MAFVTIVTVDGKEYDLSKLEQRDENRCEGCGEFLAATEIVNVTIKVYGPGIGLHERTKQAHKAHAVALAADTAAELLAEAGQ